MAALHHDWGKAHPVFQATVNPEGRAELLAKSKTQGKHARRRFRHELASALALLQTRAPDLAAYLVAAHHGKVRLSIRALPDEDKSENAGAKFARGVHDGDRLPEVQLGDVVRPALTLDLEPMLLGQSAAGEPSWMERMLSLRDEIGVFRLAYLEALMVAADWRASAEPKEVLP
jgi:CRISPR-associated endonuclease/helicase Cas3